MPTPSHLFAFALVSLVIIAIPGPSVLFSVTRSLTHGRGAGLISVVGNAAGVYLQVVAVAFGLGSLMRESITAFTIVKLAGAGYLVYLGIQAIRHRGALPDALRARVEPKTSRRLLADAFVVGVANPKAMVFFAAVLPQFADPSVGALPIQLLMLGIVFVSLALVCDGTWALVAGTARTWFAGSPRRLRTIGGTGGVVMIALGVGLAVSDRSR